MSALENTHLGQLLGMAVQGAGAATNVINALNNNQPSQQPVQTVPVAAAATPLPTGQVIGQDYTKLAIIGGVAVVGLVAAILIFKR